MRSWSDIRHRGSDVTIRKDLHDLVPFVQLKKREKHSWRSVAFSKVAGFSLQIGVTVGY